MSKSDTIKNTLRETREKRKSQVLKVYELKIDKSHLSKKTKKHLKTLFLEAKWFYNHLVSQEDIFTFNTKIKEVTVLNKDKTPETRSLSILSSEMKQALQQRMISSIKSLSTKVKKGRKDEVGKLKYKSRINSIPLRQYGKTYSIKNGTIRIQKLKSFLKVRGLNQIPKYTEYANALLIKKHNDYYIHLTCFIPKEHKNTPNESVGIDFGIKTQLTFSNGIKIESKIHVSQRSRKLHKDLSRSKRVNGLKSKTKNQYKIREKLKKSYTLTSNKKKDIKNKIISILKNNFSVIAIQNENIKGWHAGLFGKQVQESSIGGIISGIKKLPQTRMVKRNFASTKQCLNCKKHNQVTLSDRVYKCECGYECDRDIHAANNILNCIIPMEHRNFKPVENNTTVDMFRTLSDVPNLSVSIYSLKQEAAPFRGR